VPPREYNPLGVTATICELFVPIARPSGRQNRDISIIRKSDRDADPGCVAAHDEKHKANTLDGIRITVLLLQAVSVRRK
jgi:hypothetical protein